MSNLLPELNYSIDVLHFKLVKVYMKSFFCFPFRRLKLFLEQFDIKSCILNSELPSQIRCRVVQQFNMGTYDIIIASDEMALETKDEKPLKEEGSRKRKADKESGVSRGIDFQCLSNVINFDFPLDVNSYIHRAGRTARGNDKGSVLSFINVSETEMLNAVEEHLKSGYDTEEAVLK